MSKTVELLQEHGWVSRTQNPEDRRQVVIRLTDKGQSLLQNMHQDVIEQISEKLSVLSQDDMVVLDQGLRVLKKMFFDTETDRNDHRSIA
jgi:DNA-binding MarR family transcriptional regulator